MADATVGERFHYDEENDVLYVRLKDHPEADCLYTEIAGDAVFRIAPDGEPVGLTVIGFLKRYRTALTDGTKP